MDSDAAWTFLARERLAFADLLNSLTPGQWQIPSLCEGWSVRDVATHMMVGPTGTVGSFLTAMIKARGRFAVANRLMVDRSSDRPASEISAAFRTHAEDHFTPPGMDWHAPMTDFLVHRLDVTVPLGLSSEPSTRLGARCWSSWSARRPGRHSSVPTCLRFPTVPLMSTGRPTPAPRSRVQPRHSPWQ